MKIGRESKVFLTKTVKKKSYFISFHFKEVKNEEEEIGVRNNQPRKM